MATTRTCKKCKGSGAHWAGICYPCNGTGSIAILTDAEKEAARTSYSETHAEGIAQENERTANIERRAAERAARRVAREAS